MTSGPPPIFLKFGELLIPDIFIGCESDHDIAERLRDFLTDKECSELSLYLRGVLDGPLTGAELKGMLNRAASNMFWRNAGKAKAFLNAIANGLSREKTT